MWYVYHSVGLCVSVRVPDRVVEVVGDDGHGHGDEHDAREGAAHADETAARRRRIEVACASTHHHKTVTKGSSEQERHMPILCSLGASVLYTTDDK